MPAANAAALRSATVVVLRDVTLRDGLQDEAPVTTMHSSGSSVHYLDNELQRIHRDVHMMCAHTVFDIDLVAEGVGRQVVASKEPPAAAT
jgi:hypothetical protein